MWAKEEEKKKTVEEATKKIEEEKKRKEEEEIQRRQKESEGLRLKDVNKEKEQAEKVVEELREETWEEQDPADQGHAQPDADPFEPIVPSSSTTRENPLTISGIELIPFIPTEGEEVLDWNTIYYDKVKKRIVKRIEKKVNTGGKPGVMVTDKTVAHGTHKDPWLMEKDEVALSLAIEDNVDRIMTDLEQSQKKVA